MSSNELSDLLPTDRTQEFKTKLLLAAQSNDSNLIENLLLWNSVSIALRSESENFDQFAYEITCFVISNENANMMSTLSEHPPFKKLKEIALKFIISHGNLLVISEILKYNVDLTTTNNDGETFLHIAINEPITSENIIEILKIFIDYGMDINAQSNKGFTPLRLAMEFRKTEVAKFLIDGGANVNILCRNKKSLLYAILKHEYETEPPEQPEDDSTILFKLLISKGIYLNLPCCDKDYPFDYIVGRSFLRFIPLLLEHSTPINFKDVTEFSFLQQFVNFIPKMSSSSLNVIRTVLEMLLPYYPNVNIYNNYGDTLLHSIVDLFAEREGCEEIVVSLLSKGADIHLKDSMGQTPVHLAAKYKHVGLLHLFKNSGAVFNQCINTGDNMLHILAKYYTRVTNENQYREAIKFLIDNGCEINARDNNNMTPLLCSLEERNSTEIAKALIEFGADVNCKDNSGWTPLHIVVRAGFEDVLDLLIEHKAEIDCKAFEVHTTPLQSAIHRHNLSIVGKLIKAGADVNMRHINGETFLHLAASVCTDNVDSNKILSILLDAGVPINAKNHNGRTVLYDILKLDNIKGFELLFKNKFDFNNVNVQKDIFSVTNYQNKQVWINLVKHFIKLKVVNFPVPDIYNLCIDVTKGWLQSYYEKCLKEVELMEKEKAVDDITFYDILHMDVRERFNYVRKINFRVKLSGLGIDKMKSQFPEYIEFIKTSSSEAMAKGKKMMIKKTVMKAWYDLTKFRLDDICVELIISYLDERTLLGIYEEYKYFKYN